MKNKGFTIIELLVCIVIIALIGGIGIVSFNTITKRMGSNYYKSIEDSLLLSASDYFGSHRNELPINGRKSVSISNLIQNGYIEPIKDKNGNNCDGGKVYVYANDETHSYDYTVCLECGDYKSSGSICAQ